MKCSHNWSVLTGLALFLAALPPATVLAQTSIPLTVENSFDATELATIQDFAVY